MHHQLRFKQQRKSLIQPREPVLHRTSTFISTGTRKWKTPASLEPLQGLVKSCEVKDSIAESSWPLASKIMLDLFDSCVVELACDTTYNYRAKMLTFSGPLRKIQVHLDIRVESYAL